MTKFIAICLSALLFGSSMQAMHTFYATWLAMKRLEDSRREQLGEELIRATRAGELNRVKELIANGAYVDQVNRVGIIALIEAACNGHLGICKLLIENGTDVNHADKFGLTALIRSTEKGYLDVCRFLIQNGAEVNQKTRYAGDTALMIAAYNGRLGICELLIDNGGDINQPDKYGITALMRAAEKGCLEICQLLIVNHAEINCAGYYGNTTALAGAVGNGHQRICKLLIANGAQIYPSKPFGSTLLVRASYQSDWGVSKLLIDAMLMPKAQKDAIIAFLGIKKYRRPAQLKLLPYDVVKMIARDMYAGIVQENKPIVIAEIKKNVDSNIQQKSLKYVQQK